eukprot:TRINITY_DN1678_c0_g1_i1.p1 TRINITY_DN1678_c0_g1~~TRINITY_DN1678_c0_g1_i1.p1  ORF type:complete len:165 (+),score=45.99 TRINITY_DN1678_c0_g1_i1:91-585(+)
MDGWLLRDDCNKCGQKQVLGLEIADEKLAANKTDSKMAFWCYACVDEHGDWLQQPALAASDGESEEHEEELSESGPEIEVILKTDNLVDKQGKHGSDAEDAVSTTASSPAFAPLIAPAVPDLKGCLHKLPEAVDMKRAAYAVPAEEPSRKRLCGKQSPPAVYTK